MQEEALKKEEDQKLVFQAVESSNVDRVAYDGKDLYVAFINKSLYRYLDVPVTYYEGLIGAESVGRFLNQSIKGVFQFEKVDYNMLKGDQNVTTTVLSNSQAN